MTTRESYMYLHKPVGKVTRRGGGGEFSEGGSKKKKKFGLKKNAK